MKKATMLLVLLLSAACGEEPDSPKNVADCLQQCAPYSAVIPTGINTGHGSSPCSCIFPQPPPKPENCR